MAKKGRLSKPEIAKQHAAALPKREAMSLIASGLPSLPAIGGAGPYAAGAQDVAAGQASAAEEAARSVTASGANNPNGTATAFSQT